MEEPFTEKWAYLSSSQSRESSTSLHSYYEDGNGFDSKHGVLSEAADIYGDAAMAEEYGYVKRGYAISSHELKWKCARLNNT